MANGIIYTTCGGDYMIDSELMQKRLEMLWQGLYNKLCEFSGLNENNNICYYVPQKDITYTIVVNHEKR